jgi:ABC-type polysaccharide/polyol phosphate export permease
MLLVAIAGLCVIVVNCFSACILMGIVALRYPDVRETIRNSMRFVFFLTPIIWQAEMLSDRAYLSQFNPFAHFIALVRDPLLGTFPPLISWVVCLSITAAGLAAALTVFTKLRHRIPFWL